MEWEPRGYSKYTWWGRGRGLWQFFGVENLHAQYFLGWEIGHICFVVLKLGIWPDAERNRKLRGNLRAYYKEDSVNYAVKIANYVVVLEQMTRKNLINWAKKIANYADA